MPSLKHTQKQFSDAIYSSDDAKILPKIATVGISAEARLQIYRDNSFIALTNTLKNLYSAIVALVSDEFFTYAAHEYITRYPSLTGNLDDYGENFSTFLQAFEPTKNYPFLPDIARLEWARHQAYLAPNAIPCDMKTLASVAPERYEQLRFQLHPSAQLLCSPHPIDILWNITQPHYRHDPPALPSRGADMVIFRPEFKIEHLLLEPGQYAFLTSIQHGASLGEAYEATNIESFDVGQTVQTFLMNGLLVGFTLDR